MKKYIIFTAILVFIFAGLFTYFIYDSKDFDYSNLDGRILREEYDDKDLPESIEEVTEPKRVFNYDGEKIEIFGADEEIPSELEKEIAEQNLNENGYEYITNDTDLFEGRTIGDLKEALNNSTSIASGNLLDNNGVKQGESTVGYTSKEVIVYTKANLPKLDMPEDPTEELADATSLIPVYQLWIEIYIPEVEQTGYLGMGPMFQFSDTKFETILPMDLDAKDMVFKSILITKEPSYTDAEDPTLDRVVAKTIF